MNLRSPFLTFLLIISAIDFAGAQVFKNKDLQISLLQDKVWVIETADMTTMYLIEGTKKALLIDCGTKCDSLDKVIAGITKKPVELVITHAHGDHDGNVAFFPEVFMHPADTVLFDIPYKGRINFVNDGYVFDLGGKKIEVAWTPAHTPGSIILLDRPAHNAYTGDAFGSGQVWLQLRPYSPMKDYTRACEKMLKIMDTGIDSIYCGHYPYLKSALNRDYIVTMKRLSESIDNGTVKNTRPFDTKVWIGGDHPMIASDGKVAIVYDSEHIQ
jgi:hydroxyacylglutathione hydrolase